MRLSASIPVCVFLLFALAACQASKDQQFGGNEFHVAEVVVAMPPQDEVQEMLRYTDGFGTMLDNAVSHYAAEYNATRPGAKLAYVLNVGVEKVHFKNALLPGDGNNVSGSATLVDASTGRQLYRGTFKFHDTASSAVNGVAGAVLSLLVKKQAAEATLSRGTAKAIMKNIFPQTKLPSSATERLKGQAVLQTPPAALSPLLTVPATAANADTLVSGQVDG